MIDIEMIMVEQEGEKTLFFKNAEEADKWTEKYKIDFPPRIVNKVRGEILSDGRIIHGRIVYPGFSEVPKPQKFKKSFSGDLTLKLTEIDEIVVNEKLKRSSVIIDFMSWASERIYEENIVRSTVVIEAEFEEEK